MKKSTSTPEPKSAALAPLQGANALQRGNFLSRLQVGQRVLLGFGLIIALALVMGATTVFQSLSVQDNFTSYGEMVTDSAAIAKLDEELASVRLNVREYFKTTEETDRKEVIAALDTMKTEITTARERMQ